ncbi:beta-alanine transporter-like, partial [Homarus americanus]|uniref:beta-alanine transporter-like n=1 Tax=Homarus americanus TaxID=6706 RepID=UPI001C4560FD
MQAVATAFLSPTIDHWCSVPELTNWTKEQVWSFSLPRTTVGGVPHHSQCEMYVRNYSHLVGVAWEDRFHYFPDESAEVEALPTQPCPSWEYDTHTFHSTLISEWDLVCGRESLRSVIQSIFMFGIFFGAPLGGYFSDSGGGVYHEPEECGGHHVLRALRLRLYVAPGHRLLHQRLATPSSGHLLPCCAANRQHHLNENKIIIPFDISSLKKIMPWVPL